MLCAVLIAHEYEGMHIYPATTVEPAALSQVEAARYLSVSAMTLKRLGLPFVQVSPRRIVYLRRTLDEYLQAQLRVRGRAA
jgi:hypothetical protein